MNSLLNRKVSLEGKLLLMVNFADALHTAFLVEVGLLVELNPLMRLLLRYGTSTFVAGKVAIVGALVLVLELLRSRGTHVRLIRPLQWVAIIWIASAILFPHLHRLAYLVLRTPV
jgi:hypothetical protein